MRPNGWMDGWMDNGTGSEQQQKTRRQEGRSNNSNCAQRTQDARPGYSMGHTHTHTSQKKNEPLSLAVLRVPPFGGIKGSRGVFNGVSDVDGRQGGPGAATQTERSGLDHCGLQDRSMEIDNRASFISVGVNTLCNPVSTT